MIEMKALSDFTGDEALAVAADVTMTICEIMQDPSMQELTDNMTVGKILGTALKSCPKEMTHIFATLSGVADKDYTCNGQEAMAALLSLAGDPLVAALFVSQVQSGDARSSVPASENIEE